MKVILLKQQRNLGKVGEIVTVKDGYGRNYLIPQKIAIRATAENEHKLTEQKADLEKQNKEALKVATALGAKAEGKHFTFIKQCADDGRLFGSVTTKEISQELTKELGEEVCHTSILLPHPIKSLGVYEVEAIFHAEVSSTVLINVARSESEAADALKEFKSGGSKEEQEDGTEAA